MMPSRYNPYQGMTFVLIHAMNLHRRTISLSLSLSLSLPKKEFIPLVPPSQRRAWIWMPEVQTITKLTQLKHITMFPSVWTYCHSGSVPHPVRVSETQPSVSVPIASPNKWVARNINIQEESSCDSKNIHARVETHDLCLQSHRKI